MSDFEIMDAIDVENPMEIEMEIIYQALAYQKKKEFIILTEDLIFYQGLFLNEKIKGHVCLRT